MANIRILCTDQQPIYRPAEHAHIAAVGVDTDSDGRTDARHELSTVVRNIQSRTHNYYTYGPGSGKVALVEVIDCPSHCGEKVIRSTPDAVRDNNLDSMRYCHWT